MQEDYSKGVGAGQHRRGNYREKSPNSDVELNMLEDRRRKRN